MVSIVKVMGRGAVGFDRRAALRPSPKCYHFKSRVTGLNAVYDREVGIGQTVVSGTPRESLHILNALLKLDAEVKSETVATANALYCDIVVE